jgi:cathepsin H
MNTFLAFWLTLTGATAGFNANIALIESHNARVNIKYELAANHFINFSWDEFKTQILMKPQDCSATQNRQSYLVSNSTVSSEHDGYVNPPAFDWRDKGVISEVKNQGNCGSCWTFSTTGCLEAHMAIKAGAWRSSRLSEQQLLDCAGAFDNHGCDGGLPSHAFEYIAYQDGLDKEFHYPYEAKSNKCRFNPEFVGARTLRSYNITEGDEESMIAILFNEGPISIAYQVVDDFRFYSSGIYSSLDCKQGPMDVNHAVLIVGYGEEDGVKYWIVKNSWGDSWGEKGYFRIERGKNMCGLATCASYPIISESFIKSLSYDPKYFSA